MKKVEKRLNSDWQENLKRLENFFAQEKAAISLLISHSWADPKRGEIKWIPVKEGQIKIYEISNKVK